VSKHVKNRFFIMMTYFKNLENSVFSWDLFILLSDFIFRCGHILDILVLFLNSVFFL